MVVLTALGLSAVALVAFEVRRRAGRRNRAALSAAGHDADEELDPLMAEWRAAESPQGRQEAADGFEDGAFTPFSVSPSHALPIATLQGRRP